MEVVRAKVKPSPRGWDCLVKTEIYSQGYPGSPAAVGGGHRGPAVQWHEDHPGLRRRDIRRHLQPHQGRRPQARQGGGHCGLLVGCHHGRRQTRSVITLSTLIFFINHKFSKN